MLAGFILLAVAAAAADLGASGGITHVPADRFTFIDMPTPLALPCDLAYGPDGYMYTIYLLSSKVARINPNTNEVTEYDIPYTNPLAPNSSLPVAGGVAFAPCVVRPGEDGNMYMGTGLRNQLAKLDLKTFKVSVYTPPNALHAVGNAFLLNDMWGGPEDMFMSQSSANVISAFNYDTHKWRTFEVPTPASNPFGMRIASDNALWFTETIGQKIGRLNTSTGIIQEFAVPVPIIATPAVLRVETGGDMLWFTCFVSDSVGGINMYTHKFTNVKNTAPASALSIPSVDTEDKNGNVWFSTWTQNLLSYFKPGESNQTHIAIPQTLVEVPISLPFAMNVGVQYYGLEGKNRMYFSQAILNRIGYLDLESNE